MTCRQCGTEIAAKALICYRCGTATTDPVFKPARVRRSPSWIIPVLIVLALALVAVVARSSGADAPKIVTSAGVAVAVVIVGVRAYLRRR